MMRSWCSLLLAALLVAGCADASWQTKDISYLMRPLEFTLVDEGGRTVSARDYRGKTTLVFFGFTHCPDVCPMALARLAAVSRELDPQRRDDLQVLFVSIDPGRDDPASLAQYTDAFGPQFIGLTGAKGELDALTRRYRVTYGYGKKDASGNYEVSHATAVFVFDRDGKARLLIRETDDMDAVVADIRRLVQES